MNKEISHSSKKRVTCNQPINERKMWMIITTSLAYSLSLAAIISIIGICLWMGFYWEKEYFIKTDALSASKIQERPKGGHPCCLPYKFQAVITPLATFDAHKKQIMRVYRDWDSQLQVMEQTTFDDHGLSQVANRKTIYDYKQNTAFRIGPEKGQCSSWKINSGMLEPCMPDDSTYLGGTYAGFKDNKIQFDTFYFKRTDKNRSIDMTISVTSDQCVPVMEHIKGRIGSGSMDSMVFFSNLTSIGDESVFQVPEFCLR